MLKHNKRVQKITPFCVQCQVRDATAATVPAEQGSAYVYIATNTYSKRQGTNHAHEDVVLGFGVDCHIQLLHTQ